MRQKRPSEFMSGQAIRYARKQMPEMCEREFAAHLGISEVQLVDAFVGHGNIRLRADLLTFFRAIENAGEVLALSRNEGALHEKRGQYTGYKANGHASMVLGPDIDLRIFSDHWRYAYHVASRSEDGALRSSFQFFDEFGFAVHKVYETDATEKKAWAGLLAGLIEGSPKTAPTPVQRKSRRLTLVPSLQAIDAMRVDWALLKDTHQFQQMLKKHRMARLTAIQCVGPNYSRRIAKTGVLQVLDAVASADIPIMVFLRNQGILQIHSGPISNIVKSGPWLNIADDRFQLHLNAEHVDSTWIVRKPTKNGDIWSMEIFDRSGNQLLLINGYRREGDDNHLLAHWNDVLWGVPDFSDTTTYVEAAQ